LLLFASAEAKEAHFDMQLAFKYWL